MNYSEIWTNSLNEARTALNDFISNPTCLAGCQKFSEIAVEILGSDHSIFTCGNGGSHCDAMHFAEELTGRYRKDRRPLGALALGDSSHVTCVSNDYGFEHIFSRQIEGLGRTGDLLVGLSTSGNSKNVINAFQSAKKKGIKTVALLGKTGGQLKDLADLAIVAPGNDSGRIQEIHIKIIHTVIETIERKLFPENY